MPAETRLPSPYPPYEPSTRRRDRARAALARITAKDILFGLLAILAALGWSISSPGKRIDYLTTATAAHFDTTDKRVGRIERRVDTLAEAQRFTNYMLCVNARRTDPASVPPDCAPVIESRRVK